MAFTPFKKLKEKRRKKKQRRKKYDPSPLGSMQMKIDALARERQEIKYKISITHSKPLPQIIFNTITK